MNRSTTQIIALIVLVFFSQKVNAQNEYNFNSFKTESVEFLKIPGSWNTSDWLKIAGIGTASFVLMHFDDDIRSRFQKLNGFQNSIPFETGRIWGEPATSLLIGTFFLLHGRGIKNNVHERIGYEILQSSLYTVAVTQIFKISFGRQRPSTAENAFNFSPFSLNENNFSFFSGHTSLAFSLSTILSANSKGEFLKIAAYFPAVLTGFSRVYQNQHWASDVLVGALVGYFIGKWVNQLHDAKSNNIVFLESNVPLIHFSLNLSHFFFIFK